MQNGPKILPIITRKPNAKWSNRILDLALLDKLCWFQIVGSFALTEVAHGTDARRVRTTATYDPDAREFVLHTEDFLAAKCWIGNLGTTKISDGLENSR